MEIAITSNDYSGDNNNSPTFGEITDTLDSTRVFGAFLSKSLATIKMVHWYVLNYDAHIILGDLYDDLNKKFDILQEEIISTARQSGLSFPMIAVEKFDLENLSQFRDNTSRIIDSYLWTHQVLVKTLGSTEFKGYVSQVHSGIQNTVDDILSKLNKANYLISMIKD